MIRPELIAQARARIQDSIYVSPCARSETFSKLTGLSVHFKLENLQMTGSFKERGALNCLLTLNDTERAAGVICASAGNHAQGVAYHGTRLGMRSVVVMPETTPLIKVVSTREYGGDVILHGDGYAAACVEAKRRAALEGLTFVHAFDDEAVIAGQGTIGLELLEQVPKLDAVVVPVGGGGLIGGIACAIKSAKPSVIIIGVQTTGYASARAALEHGGPVTLPSASTIADGIAVCRIGDHTYPLIRDYVDDIVTVEEEELANAILLLLEREKTLAEGAGAAPLAAVLNEKTSLSLGSTTALLVCGGNIDVTMLSRIIERGLAKDARLIKLEIRLADSPGALKTLLALFARYHGNILDVTHSRAFGGGGLGETVVSVTLEARGHEHAKQILAALRSVGYQHRRHYV